MAETDIMSLVRIRHLKAAKRYLAYADALMDAAIEEAEQKEADRGGPPGVPVVGPALDKAQKLGSLAESHMRFIEITKAFSAHSLRAVERDQ